MSEALTAPDFSTIPVGPLALIALPGCEELAAKIDAYLKTWREIRESEHKTTIAFSGYQRDRRQGKTHHRHHAHALRRKTAQAFKQRIP